MKMSLGVPLAAVLLAALVANSVDAGYCGAAKYSLCGRGCDAGSYAGCKQQCHTVMKTCKEVVYEKQNYTCYKTVYETVCENKVINCVKYVQETCYRDC